MKIKITGVEVLEEFFNNIEDKGFSLPDFQHSDEIIIFSDYSGDTDEDNYHSYSFFITNKQSLTEAATKILQLRERENSWKNNSFIEYKSTGDKVRSRILPEFLKIFDESYGLVATILIDKKSTNYFTNVKNSDVKLTEQIGLGHWKIPVLVKISNILSILSFLIRTFVKKTNKLTWYSDRDDIFGANQLKENYTLEMLFKFFEVFDIDISKENFRHIIDNGTLINSDFMAVPDLSAGGVLEYYQKSFHREPLKPSTEQIFGWMALNSSKLKKLMLVGTNNEGGTQLLSIKNY